jgi:hypothetical protein
MIHEELKQLESIYLQLNNAYYNGDKYKMKSLFDNFTKQFPQYNLSKQNNIFEVFEEHGEKPGLPCSIYLIEGSTLLYNIEGCIRTIWTILESYKYQTFSSHCIEVLYFPQKEFAPTDILYTVPIQHDNDEKPNRFKVSDLLLVAKYSLQVLEIIQPNEKTSDISDTITVMQSIDLALNNKPYDKPLNKSLHIVNSVLTSVVKRNLENESDKRFISIMGLLIDLAIDFFTAKK